MYDGLSLVALRALRKTDDRFTLKRSWLEELDELGKAPSLSVV
jgi:hypothetical protein